MDMHTTEKGDLTIRTSDSGWFAELAKAYRNRIQIVLIDDAKTGIDPSAETLLAMGLKRKLCRHDWIAVLISLGLGGWGVAMVVLAIVDPDPTSKLGLLIASGAFLTFGGGFSAISILSNRKPPRVRVSSRGFEIGWE